MVFNKESMLKEIIPVIVTITITSVIFLFLDNKLSNNLDNAPSEEIKIITLRKAYDLWLSKQGIFIDARPNIFYHKMHISRSISFPYKPSLFSNKTKIKKLERLSKHEILIIYCDSKACNLSKELAIYLIMNGYKNVYILAGGIDEWQKEGLPIFKK